MDIIQEVQIPSVGASAEYGNIQGAVINAVTRQGGNRFQYDTSYYTQAGALTSRPVLQSCAGCNLPETGYVRARYRDMTTHVGGPILRDRAWFFGGYQHLRDFDSQPGTDSAFPRKYEMDKVFGKVTWQAAQALRFLHSYHYESWASAERPTSVRPFEVTRRPNGRIPTSTFAHVSHVLSARTMWDARVGRFVREEHGEPSTGIRTIPSRFDRVTGVFSGGVTDFGGLTLIRPTGKATLTRYQPRRVGADHEWKTGVQIERGEHHGYGIIPTGTRYVDSNGQPFQAISAPAGVSGGRFVTAGLFVSDAAMIGTRVIVNAGVRYDYNRAVSQDLRGRDSEGRTRVADAARSARLADCSLRIGGSDRAAPGRPERAERNGRGIDRDRQSVQPELRAPHDLSRSAPGDAGDPLESRRLTKARAITSVAATPRRDHVHGGSRGSHQRRGFHGSPQLLGGRGTKQGAQVHHMLWACDVVA